MPESSSAGQWVSEAGIAVVEHGLACDAIGGVIGQALDPLRCSMSENRGTLWRGTRRFDDRVKMVTLAVPIFRWLHPSGAGRTVAE